MYYQSTQGVEAKKRKLWKGNTQNNWHNHGKMINQKENRTLRKKGRKYGEILIKELKRCELKQSNIPPRIGHSEQIDTIDNHNLHSKRIYED